MSPQHPLLRLVIVTLALGTAACGSNEGEALPPAVERSVVEAPADVLSPAEAAEAAPPPLVEPASVPDADDPSPIALEPAPGAQEVVPLEHPEAFEEAPPADPYPELSDLLRLSPPEELPPTGPQSVEWAGKREAQKRAEDEKKARARLDFSQENVTEGVPMQKERRRTDVGVSVPVGESDRLRVKGGLRVNERELSEAEREADTAPTVGVEVKF